MHRRTPKLEDPLYPSCQIARPLDCPPADITNVLSVDVEDYFHVSAFAHRIAQRQWNGFESRVVQNTQRILRLFDQYQTRATFYVLGWVADRVPDLVREIQRAGHEIGSHSFSHRLVYDMTPDEFREDLSLSRKVLEEITGQPVTAFRAPSFSIVTRTLWALEVLAEEGWMSDSSVFPIYHDRYGIADAPRFPALLELKAGTLWEFPLSVLRVCGLNLPVSGGGYFRLYPARFSTHCLRRINRRQRYPFVFYIHPWELDPDQPRLPGSRRSQLRHYNNLAHTEAKLERLLKSFRFAPISEVLSGLRTPARSIPSQTFVEPALFPEPGTLFPAPPK
jgi:polysaccharide deacetylase family protein (PEP-CTERM system associated)